jgi:hypothetical protein
MSRRAKLWILGIFLLLLTGPVIYLALSWSPENPLRFRVVESQTTGASPASTDEAMLIEVENTTSFPLLLFFGEIVQEDARTKRLGLIRPRDQTEPGIRVSGTDGIELDGLQRVRLLATMEPDWRTRATQHGAKVKYIWVSETASWFAIQWGKMPSWVRSFLPEFLAANDEVPLEPFAKARQAWP